MPPSPPPRGSVRSAAELNAAIRALLERTRRQLSDVEREEYEQLVVEYAAATKAEVVKAA
jgi:hypothetical protein